MTFLNKSLKETKQFFDQLNRDCEKSGYGLRPLVDVEYYAEQIFNLNGEKKYDACWDKAEELALHQKKCDAQAQGCKDNNWPHFMPNNGFCWHCGESIFKNKTVEQAKSPMTGCHCGKSYCD